MRRCRGRAPSTHHLSVDGFFERIPMGSIPPTSGRVKRQSKPLARQRRRRKYVRKCSLSSPLEGRGVLFSAAAERNRLMEHKPKKPQSLRILPSTGWSALPAARFSNLSDCRHSSFLERRSCELSYGPPLGVAVHRVVALDFAQSNSATLPAPCCWSCSVAPGLNPGITSTDADGDGISVRCRGELVPVNGRPGYIHQVYSID